MNKQKGDLYEIHVKNHISNTLNKQAYLWKDIPEAVLIATGLIHSHNKHRLNRKEKRDTGENFLIDVGVDVIQCNDDDNFTLVQCKNGYKTGIRIEDLAGFYMMMMLHEKMNGAVYYTSKLSVHIRENNINPRVQYIKLLMDKQKEEVKEDKNIIVPYDYQLDAVKELHKELQIKNKAVLSIPCGCGKTFISYLLSKHYKNVILISPLKQFAKQNMIRFIEYGYDEKNTLLVDSDGTRDSDEVMKFIENKTVLISATYKSVDIINEVIDKMKDVIIIVDEFHGLSKNNVTDKTDEFYKLLNTKNKFMFMSATPRVYELEDDAEDGIGDSGNDNEESDEESGDSYSDGDTDAETDTETDAEIETETDEETDDESIKSDATVHKLLHLGNIVYNMSFTYAINKKYITDYRIYLPSVSEDLTELVDNIKEEIDISKIDDLVIGKCNFLYKCLLNNGSKKCIVYCEDTKEITYMRKAMKKLNDFYLINIHMDQITSDDSHSKRDDILRTFQDTGTDTVELLFSVRILDECIDIPKCDSIYITYPSKSKIRTIQRMCRCIRINKDNKNKIGNVYIWCNEYDAILETIRGIKEYDVEFTNKISIMGNNFYNKSDKKVITKDVEMMKKYVVGIKEWRAKMWEETLQKVKQYIDEHGKRPVYNHINKNKDKDIRYLGKWLSHQFNNYSKKIHIMKDDNIRKKWEEFTKEYSEHFLSTEQIWNNNLMKLKQYIDDTNKRPSNSDGDKDIRTLAHWIITQKNNYDKKIHNMTNNDIRNKWEKFIDEYKEYFMSTYDEWNTTLEKTKQYINDNKKRPLQTDENKKLSKLGRWLSHQQHNYMRNINNMKDDNIKNKWKEFIDEYKIYFTSSEELWDNNLEKVKKYIDDNKKRPTETNKNKDISSLGSWIQNQQINYNKKIRSMKDDTIKKKWEEFIKNYDIYFLSNEQVWDNNLQKVKKYIDDNHKRPSMSDDDKNIKTFAQWIQANQRNYSTMQYIMKNNDIRKKWEEFVKDYKKYFALNDEDIWNDNLEKVKKYINDNKKRPLQTDENKKLSKLGRWLSHQQHNYMRNINNMKDDIIRKKWEDFVKDYKEYFMRNEELWNNNLEKVKKYINDNEKRPSTHSKNKDILFMGSWINTQQNNYSNKKDNMTNNNIRKQWEEFTKEYAEHFMSNEEVWKNTLEKVKKYIDDNNKKPSLYDKNKDVKSLGKWLSHQKDNYNKKIGIIKNDDIKKQYEDFLEEYAEYFE